jgi:hypothetical protein
VPLPKKKKKKKKREKVYNDKTFLKSHVYLHRSSELRPMQALAGALQKKVYRDKPFLKSPVYLYRSSELRPTQALALRLLFACVRVSQRSLKYGRSSHFALIFRLLR